MYKVQRESIQFSYQLILDYMSGVQGIKTKHLCHTIKITFLKNDKLSHLAVH